ncbi:hypothetical protein REPUB_Repub17cG0117700 [Reevesia pubescens]
MLPSNFKKLLSVQLNKFMKSEKLVKVKNSYKVAKKVSEKRKRTKRLSQIKTPEALKKAKKEVKKLVLGSKVKRLSQVKTPNGLKRKNLRSGNKAKVAKKTRK